MAAERVAQALDAAIATAEASPTKTTVVSAEFLKMMRGAGETDEEASAGRWLSESMAADAKRYGME